jgi:hypothetical protein
LRRLLKTPLQDNCARMFLEWGGWVQPQNKSFVSESWWAVKRGDVTGKVHHVAIYQKSDYWERAIFVNSGRVEPGRLTGKIFLRQFENYQYIKSHWSQWSSLVRIKSKIKKNLEKIPEEKKKIKMFWVTVSPNIKWNDKWYLLQETVVMIKWKYL